MEKADETRIYNVSCPFCGATFARPEGKFILTCEYCGRRSWLKVDNAIPKTILKPKTTREQATYILKEHVFNDNQTPRDMATAAVIVSAQLYFVPYYEYSGWRGSLIEQKVTDSFDQSKSDTAVSLFDFTVYAPAATLEGWGIDKFDPNNLTSNERLQQEPFVRKELIDMNAIVINPEISKEDVKQKLKEMGRLARTIASEVVVDRIKFVYFPFWRIRYRYGGRDYTATIDATDGKILFAHSPRADHFRLPLFVAFLAIGAWAIATIFYSLAFHPETLLWIIRFAMLADFTFIITICALIFFLLGFTVLFGLAWDSVRYPQQMIYRPDGKTVDRVGRPQMTVFDKLAYHELKLIGSILAGFGEAQKRKGEVTIQWWGRWR